MQVWTKSSYVNVFRDLRMQFSERLETHHLVMARNEYQSFQVCLRSNSEFTIKSLTFSDLSGEQGSIGADQCRYNYVQYVYCPRNSIAMKPSDGIRPAPDYFPDPLSNDRSIDVARKSTQPIWITVHVPAASAAGEYSGQIDIHTTLGVFTVPIAVEVCAVTLPDSNRGTLDYMHHQQITGAWWMPASEGYYPWDPITVCYGYKRWTRAWWTLMEDFALKMREHRQNVLYVNTPQLLLDGGTELNEQGKFSFGWSKLDEYIDFFMKRGVIKGLEGTHIASIDYHLMHFTTFLLRRNSEGALEIGMASHTSDESENWLEQFLPALQAHIEEKGWLDIWFQHIGDEAMNDAQLAQYAHYYDKIRMLAPKLKVGDPVTHVDFSRYLLELGTDIQIPIQSAYDENREFFNQAAAQGVRLYLYNCCLPAGGWLNRIIDKPVWNMRVLGWLLYRWGIKGFLHWGFNFWNDWVLQEHLEISEEEFKGDHYTVYPDPHFPDKIRSSIRYEANRDAAQDYELLTILGAKAPEKAQGLVDRIARDSRSDFERNVDVLLRVREELVREAAKVSGES